MIEGRCISNADEAKGKIFPKMFVAVPRVGEYVESSCGYRMKVASICYKVISIDGDYTPVVIVELTRMGLY